MLINPTGVGPRDTWIRQEYREKKHKIQQPGESQSEVPSPSRKQAKEWGGGEISVVG